MIRTFGFSALLSACSFDATIGLRATPIDIDAGPIDSAFDAAPFDAGATPDLPANFAFLFSNLGGPVLDDGSGHVFADQTMDPSGTLAYLVRLDRTTAVRDYVGVPVTAMAQDDTTIYAIGTTGDILAIDKTPYFGPTGGPIDAGNPTFTVTTIAHVASAVAIAVDASAVYLAAGNSLIRMDRSGANQTSLATANNLASVAVDGSYVYTAERLSSGRLLVVPRAGGGVVTLASGLANPTGLDLALGYVYVAEQDGNAIGRAAVGGSYARIITDARAPVQLAHDGSYLYWTSYSDGLMRAPIAGGTAELRMPSWTAGNAAVAIAGDDAMFVGTSDTGGREVRGVIR